MAEITASIDRVEVTIRVTTLPQRTEKDYMEESVSAVMHSTQSSFPRYNRCAVYILVLKERGPPHPTAEICGRSELTGEGGGSKLCEKSDELIVSQQLLTVRCMKGNVQEISTAKQCTTRARYQWLSLHHSHRYTAALSVGKRTRSNFSQSSLQSDGLSWARIY